MIAWIITGLLWVAAALSCWALVHVGKRADAQRVAWEAKQMERWWRAKRAGLN